MNPILLKLRAPRGAQLIVFGKVDQTVLELPDEERFKRLKGIVTDLIQAEVLRCAKEDDIYSVFAAIRPANLACRASQTMSKWARLRATKLGTGVSARRDSA